MLLYPAAELWKMDEVLQSAIHVARVSRIANAAGLLVGTAFWPSFANCIRNRRSARVPSTWQARPMASGRRCGREMYRGGGCLAPRNRRHVDLMQSITVDDVGIDARLR